MNHSQEQHNDTKSAEKKVTILNRYGLHGLPTTMFVKLANTFSSDINVCRLESDNHEEVNGKSVIALLSLGFVYGVKFLIKAKGEDAVEAVTALSNLVNNKFEEM